VKLADRRHRYHAGVVAVVFWGALSLAATAPAAAQTRADDRDAFIEETARLKRDNPQLYRAVLDAFTLLTEMLLGRLGYDVGPFDGVLDDRTRAAVRRYQNDHKLPATGDPFSFDTVQAVRADEEILNSSPISLRPKQVFTDRWDRGDVSADGTWTVAGEAMAWPEQTSTITCERAQAVCREATALISGKGSGRILTVDVQTYEIERWNDEEIVTKPRQFGCTGTVQRWNRRQKSVTGVRRTTSNEGSCRDVERIEVDLVLEDGNEVSRQLVEKQRDAWRHIMRVSPEVVKRLTDPALQ
jgi:hypothetical protein